MLAEFHFLQPLWLLLFPLLLALSYLWLRVRNTRQYWSEVCDPELLPLLVKEGQVSSRRAPVLAVLVSFLLAVAAAQPVWEKQPSPAFKQGGAVVIAWDLSASMNAVDIKPSRLQRSRFKIEDMLGKLQDSQVALLVYAGEAFVVTPLTEDADTIRAQLAAMAPEIMPAQGSRADKALQLAGEMLTQAGVQGGDILLVSDEVAPAQVAAQASRLRQQGRQLSILAVGTAQGAPVPTEYGPLKDQRGKVILARTDLSQMQEAASLGGGDAVRLANDDSDLSRLIAGFISKGSKGKRTSVEDGIQVDRWIAKGPWLVLFALPLLLPLFRRGMLNLLLPALLLGAITAAPEAEAGLWQELWQSPDQQAAKHYQAGDKAAAARQFSDPRWKQVAQYENAEYEAALDSLPEPETAADWYNRGNVLARTGKLDEAIGAYDQALQQQADHTDAGYNKKLLEDLLQQQEEQKKQQQQNQQDQNQQGPQDKQSGQQQDDQSGEPQNNQDQQQADQNQQQSEQNQQPDSADQQQQQSQNQSDETEAAQPANKQSEQDQQRNAENQQQAADYLKQQLDQRQQEQQSEDKDIASQALQLPPVDEAEQARQQLLNRIVDDPAGLWRRKFIYQYRQQAEKNSVEEKQW